MPSSGTVREYASRVHESTPEQFEQWQDYAMIPVVLLAAAAILALALSPLYVFTKLARAADLGGLYFGLGCYVMFIVFVYSRWS